MSTSAQLGGFGNNGGSDLALKVFISWSGDQSHALAAVLHDWLPTVLHFVDPWMSSKDIAKGKRWDAEIANNLEKARYCIVCVTPGVQQEPWVNFEAGAVSKIINDSYVSPLLLGVSPDDLLGLPLSQFQCTPFEKDEVGRLLRSINQAAGSPTPEVRLDKNLDYSWARLEDKIHRIRLDVRDPVDVDLNAAKSTSAPILDRICQYLDDISQWSLSPRDDGCNGDFYHQVHPEISIKCADAPDDMARNEEWTRGEIRQDNNHAGFYDVYHNQQRLTRVRYVSFDDYKKSMVAPQWEVCGKGRFYFYESGSIEYAVHQFYCQIQRKDDAQLLHIGKRDSASARQLRDFMKRRTGMGYYRIPVLQPGEFEAFRASESYPPTDSSGPERDYDKQYELFLQNQLAFEVWRENGKLRSASIRG